MGSKRSKFDLAQFHEEVYVQADKTIQYFIYGFFGLGLVLAFFHDTWQLAFFMGGGSLLLFLLSKKFLALTVWFRVIVSLLFWNFALQFLLQMHGMYEFHFLFFVSLTVLLYYEDRWAIIPACMYAMLSVFGIYYIQVNEIDTGRYLQDSLVYSNVAIFVHIFIMLFYSGLCVLWASVQRKQTASSGKNMLVMNEKLRFMDANINFANRISKGELDSKYESEDTDALGMALQDMRSNLVDAKEREETEKYINVGMAEVGDILRNNLNDLDLLCDEVISKLVGYMKANQGGIFIINDEDKHDTYLELKACRAFDKKKYLDKKIAIGNGMVGQVYVEGESKYLKEVPNDFVNIRSGMGGANPRSVIIVPLKSNDDKVGVIELASFQMFSKTDILFLEKVGESIASTVISAKINQKTSALLEESEMMTEQMKSQEEEMRQNMEELQATQEEMGRKQVEIQNKEANIQTLIDNTDESIFAIDRDYLVTVVNKPLQEKYKRQGIDLVPGKNILELLPPEKRTFWKERYDKVLSGISTNETTETKSDSKSNYMHRKELPIINPEGEITGASVISRDVTNFVEQQKNAESQKAMLDSIINSTRNSILVVNKNYDIIMMNEVLVNRYKGTEYEAFTIGSSVIELLGDLWDIWKVRYDTGLNGKKMNFILPSHSGDAINYREYFVSPVVNSEKEIVGVAVISHEIEEVDQSKVEEK